MSVSPHRALADELRGLMRSGDLRPGDVLPTQVELATTHGVSRETAAHAVRVLAEEGLVRATPYRGTVVLDRTRVVLTDRPDGHRLDDGWHDVGEPVAQQDPPQPVADLFGPRRRPQGRTHRVGGEDGVCQIATVWRVPTASVAGADWTETVSVRLPTAEEARVLGVSPRSPVLCLLRVGRAGGTVVEVADLVLPGRFELQYPVHRDGHGGKGRNRERTNVPIVGT